MNNQPLAGDSPLLNIMSRAVYKAARRLVRDFGEVENLQVSKKGPGDFVTNADRAAEDILRQELLKARPKFGFLLEEGGVVVGEDINHTWLIDPLDGTTNFLHGLPHFAISVALKRQHEIIAAMVYDPVRDELFFAEKGRGAFLNNKRLRVSSRRNPDDALLATGMPVKDKSAFLEVIHQVQKVGPSIASIRNMGSIALDMAYVAAGRLDGFWHLRFSPWDVAAGILLIREAGGYVTDSARNMDVLNADSIIASNEYLHPTLCKVLGEVQAQVKAKQS
jgi:myo-inositol-1(or 4)-monophosphatase